MEIDFIKGKEGKFVPKLVNFKWERKQGINKWPEKIVKDLGEKKRIFREEFCVQSELAKIRINLMQ